MVLVASPRVARRRVDADAPFRVNPLSGRCALPGSVQQRVYRGRCDRL